MKKKIVDFPCVCGHSKEVHGYVGPPIGEEWCDGLLDNFLIKISSFEIRCDCYCYTPDNLRYLEKMSNKKNRKG